jgi:hypothetical protein
VTQGDAFRGSMGVSMPGPKLGQRLAISRSGGESGRGPVCGVGGRRGAGGVGAAGFQDSSFSESGH